MAAVGKQAGKGKTKVGKLHGLATKSQEGIVEAQMGVEAAGVCGCGQTRGISRRKLHWTW